MRVESNVHSLGLEQSTNVPAFLTMQVPLSCELLFFAQAISDAQHLLHAWMLFTLVQLA